MADGMKGSPIVEVAPRLARSPSTLGRRAWIAALFLVVFFRVILLPRFVPGILLDSSYAAALTYFRSHGIQFGKDVVYTFGPLGYLLTGVFTGYAESAQVGGAFALAAVLAFLFCGAAMQLPPFPRFLWIAAALVSDHNEAIYLAAPAAALLLVLAPRRQREVVLVLIGAGAGLIASVKFTFFIAAAGAIAAIAILFWIRQERRQAFVCVSAFLGGYALLWAVFGGGWGAFWLYLRGSIELAAGYGQVMYIRPGPLELACGLACATLCSMIAASAFVWTKEAADRINALLWTAILFLAWKHAFLRADAPHLLTFFLFVPLFLAGVLAGRVPKALRIAQTSAAVLVVAVTMVAMVRGNPGQVSRIVPRVWVDDTLQGFRGAFRVGAKIQELHEQLISQAQQYDLGDLKATIGANPVDVFGQSQSLAILNGLTYRPRPVFQSFASFTPYLIRRNYDYFLTSAPPFVLFGYGAVNGAYPAQNDSLALAWILANYTAVGARFDHLLLRKVGDTAVASEAQLIGERTIGAGEQVDVPVLDNGFVWCTIDYPLTVVLRLKALLFQPRNADITIGDGVGMGTRYRFEREPANVGFILNPVLKDITSVAEYLCGVDVGRARTLKLDPEKGVERARVRFYAMPVHRNAGAVSVCEGPMVSPLSVMPAAIRGYHRAVEVDGKTRLLAHAPAKVTLEVPSGARSVRGEFGFMPGAYENGGSTDGVVFRVLSENTSGAPTVLWQRWLRPVASAQDRGILSFRTDIPDGVHALVLETGPGPAGDSSWDWSVWSSVRFEPARGSGQTITGPSPRHP